MEDESSIEAIRQLILTNKHPSYQTTDRREIRVVCPYCDDARHKDPGKFYIAMKPPFMFHCKRCETSGILTAKVLQDLGIYEASAGENLILANKEFKDNQKIQHISYKRRNLKNIVSNSKAESAALLYFNQRYGTNYTAEEVIEKFKAVLDANYFFQENKIYASNKQFDCSHAIGFISADSTHIIFRDITGQQNLRYNNLNIEKSYEDASKLYNISSNIDTMQDEVNLVITEGIFDIIGVYNYFYKGTPEEENTIFAAACGKSYGAVILKYIRMGFLNLNISIYSDADVDISFYRELKKSSPYLKNSRIIVYYNDKYNPVTKYGKDYGVRREEISLRKAII